MPWTKHTVLPPWSGTPSLKLWRGGGHLLYWENKPTVDYSYSLLYIYMSHSIATNITSFDHGTWTHDLEMPLNMANEQPRKEYSMTVFTLSSARRSQDVVVAHLVRYGYTNCKYRLISTFTILLVIWIGSSWLKFHRWKSSCRIIFWIKTPSIRKFDIHGFDHYPLVNYCNSLRTGKSHFFGW